MNQALVEADKNKEIKGLILKSGVRNIYSGGGQGCVVFKSKPKNKTVSFCIQALIFLNYISPLLLGIVFRRFLACSHPTLACNSFGALCKISGSRCTRSRRRQWPPSTVAFGVVLVKAFLGRRCAGRWLHAGVVLRRTNCRHTCSRRRLTPPIDVVQCCSHRAERDQAGHCGTRKYFLFAIRTSKKNDSQSETSTFFNKWKRP